MRLTKKVTGAGQGAKGEKAPPGVGFHPRNYGTSAGVVIDGVAYPLEGEPDIAVSQGWGDMTWWYQPEQ